jgi:flagellar basal body-associated protein FliL
MDTVVSPIIPNETSMVKTDTSSKEEPNNSKNKEKGVDLISILIIGAVVVCIVFLLYYAYGMFVLNTGTESTSSNNKPPAAQASSNYNLQASVNKLKGIQDKILQRLSTDVGL